MSLADEVECANERNVSHLQNLCLPIDSVQPQEVPQVAHSAEDCMKKGNYNSK